MQRCENLWQVVTLSDWLARDTKRLLEPPLIFQPAENPFISRPMCVWWPIISSLSETLRSQLAAQLLLFK